MCDGKTCKDICKHFPPEKGKWPCEDCDIRYHDRAEPYGKWPNVNVGDCMAEIRRIKDALDTIDRFVNREMSNMVEQHVNEIRVLLERYMDVIAEMRIKN